MMALLKYVLMGHYRGTLTGRRLTMSMKWIMQAPEQTAALLKYVLMEHYKGALSGVEVDYVKNLAATSPSTLNGALGIYSYGALQGYCVWGRD